MSPERWEKVKRIFHEVLERPADDRNDHLALACGHDAELRGEVERLLCQHEQGQSFLEKSILSELPSGWASALAEPEDLLSPGTRMSGYTIQRVIGHGGMGIVYHAIKDESEQPVALKVLRIGFGKQEIVKRFQRETKLLARLHHPGIAKIFETGTSEDETGNRPFFAMELVEGLTVRRYAQENNLSIKERLMLVAKIAEAVHHAHEHGIVHRDLKPSNIMVSASGQPKVLDFGVARAIDSDGHATTLRTEVGRLIGTIAYMSPEQVAGVSDELDSRSDIYALGVVAYELLTGRLPYDVANKPIPEAIRIISHDDPTPLSAIDRMFRGQVEIMLSKALEKDRDRRYQSAQDFAADIRRYLLDKPIVARRTSTLYQLRRFAHRNRALVAAVVLAFLVLVAGIVGTTIQTLEARDQLRTVNEVNDFLHDLLESPFYDKRGRAVTVLDLYDTVPGELENRFPDKPEVKAPIYLAIGNTYQQVGFADKAESYVREGYRYFLEAYGEDHDETVNAMAWLALLLERQGKLAEAEQLGRHTLRVHSGMQGSDHTFPIGTIVNLANTLRQQDKFDEAEQLLRDVLEQYKRTPKEYATNLYYAHAILARLLVATNRPAEAEGYALLAYDGFLDMFGETDWRTLYALGTRARVDWVRGRTGEAEILMQDVLVRRRSALGDNHPETVSAMYELGVMLASRGAHGDAMALTEEALSLADGMMRPEHWRVARLLALRGKCKFHLGSIEASVSDLTTAYERLDASLGDRHSETTATLRQLITLLEAQGRTTLAAKHSRTLAGDTPK